MAFDKEKQRKMVLRHICFHYRHRSYRNAGGTLKITNDIYRCLLPTQSRVTSFAVENNFSHVKYSFIKMKNVKRRKKTLFSYFSYTFCSPWCFRLFMFTPRQLVSIYAEKYFHFGVWYYSGTTTTEKHDKLTQYQEPNHMVGRANNYDSTLLTQSQCRDGMKGPICSMIYTFPIHILLFFQHFKKNQTARWAHERNTQHHLTTRYWLSEKEKLSLVASKALFYF